MSRNSEQGNKAVNKVTILFSQYRSGSKLFMSRAETEEDIRANKCMNVLQYQLYIFQPEKNVRKLTMNSVGQKKNTASLVSKFCAPIQGPFQAFFSALAKAQTRFFTVPHQKVKQLVKGSGNTFQQLSNENRDPFFTWELLRSRTIVLYSEISECGITAQRVKRYRY